MSRWMPFLVAFSVFGCDVEGTEPGTGDDDDDFEETEPRGFACGGIVCEAGEVCVFFDTRVQTQLDAGPRGLFACRADPCAPAALDCFCAQTAICGGVGVTCDVSGGVLTCRNTL
jgi:hypothetical protein